MKKHLFPLLFCLGLSGCMGGGTHGYLKRYRYAVPKQRLEEAVRHILAENPAIRQDRARDYYNDNTNYVTLTLLHGGRAYAYTFHYYGGEAYWKTSPTAAIAIVYAHNDQNQGGSAGNGGVKWYDFPLRQALTQPFERELVAKLDQQLGMTHTDE